MPRGFFNFIVKGADDVLNRINPQRAQRKLRIAMREDGERTVSILQSHTPVDTGRLRLGWDFDTQQIGEELVNVVSNPVQHGPYVNVGTGIFIGRGLIRPTRGRLMVFQVGGRTIFAKAVRGQPGQRFVEAAMQEAEPAHPTIISQNIQERLDGR